MLHPKPTDSDLDTTKHSDYFVWKDTSERVARRCNSDYTVDKKRVNSWVLKHLFSEGVEQPKISSKNSGNTFSEALPMSRFQNFAADAASLTKVLQFFLKKNRAPRGFLNPRFARFSLIQINPGPNILRSYSLHCPHPRDTHYQFVVDKHSTLLQRQCPSPRIAKQAQCGILTDQERDADPTLPSKHQHHSYSQPGLWGCMKQGRSSPQNKTKETLIALPGLDRVFSNLPVLADTGRRIILWGRQNEGIPKIS